MITCIIMFLILLAADATAVIACAFDRQFFKQRQPQIRDRGMQLRAGLL